MIDALIGLVGLAIIAAMIVWSCCKVASKADYAIDRLADDGNPLTSDRPETNLERVERYRRAAAHARNLR